MCTGLVKMKRLYKFIFKANNLFSSVDATADNGRLGRLVNDSTKPNCIVKKPTIHSLPCLCIYALKDIGPGTELICDYGVKDLPWRLKACFFMSEILHVWNSPPCVWNSLIAALVKLFQGMDTNDMHQLIQK